MIAALITQHHGEYVFRIGLQPSQAKLFAGELSDDVEGWTGIARTDEELNFLRDEIKATVEEVGGKACNTISLPVCFLMHISLSRHPYSFKLRQDLILGYLCCYDYLHQALTSPLKFGVQSLEMWIVASLPRWAYSHGVWMLSR